MKTLIEYVDISKWPSEMMITEMPTICKRITIGKQTYKIAVHGLLSGDRPTPHLHVYLSSDTRPYNKFNFEISLCDILCKDEINIIKMRDEVKHINKVGRSKYSWNGYGKLEDGIEDWLFSKATIPGDFRDNLDACIYWYNNEGDNNSSDNPIYYNPILDHMNKRGWKVLPKYESYIRNYDM